MSRSGACPEPGELVASRQRHPCHEAVLSATNERIPLDSRQASPTHDAPLTVRNVAILVAASPTPAFYSQVAMLDLALRKQRWRRWHPDLHLYLGGHRDAAADARWLPRVPGVALHWATDSDFARDGDWAQSDDVFRHAPEDADVVIAMDADTLPVADLEDVLEAVDEAGSVAGVIAHYPPVPTVARDQPADGSIFPSDQGVAGNSLREAWTRFADGLTDAPLSFRFAHTLMATDAPDVHRLTPFYLNFGVVFFAGAVFRRVAERYLAMRPKLMDRMPDADFSGQVALTLAIADAGIPTRALPMRYNFPNDPIAEQMYPNELASVVVYHYLRTAAFNRHEIFVDATRYAQFLDAPLSGVDRCFRDAVEEIAGSTYPFR